MKYLKKNYMSFLVVIMGWLVFTASAQAAHPLITDDAGTVGKGGVQLEITGEEGLEILKKSAPDLSIVDIRLPGMDGNTFMIEAHHLLPRMKFLIFTGSMEYILTEGVHVLGLMENHILKKL